VTVSGSILGLGDVRKLGRPGGMAVLYYLSTTVLAVVLGLAVVNIIRPGIGTVDEATLAEVKARSEVTSAKAKILDALAEATGPPLSLQEAAAIGDVNMVCSLLDKGVGVDSWDDSLRKTALQRAAMSGHKDVVKLLLAKGARIDAQEDFPGGTALDYAAENGHEEIVELLISKGADISPLNFALYMKDQAKAKSMIEGGVDVNKPTPYGTTPLHRAAGAGFKDIAKLLIDKGANVNARDSWNWTPLHSAVSKDMIELLIAKGANVNARDGDGRTPLWYAEKQDYTTIVELLHKHGAKE